MSKSMNILNVTLDQVDRVYSGRPGCGCGCRGEYYSVDGTPDGHTKKSSRMVKNVLSKFQRLEREKPGSFSKGSVSGYPYVGVQSNIFYWETDTRYYWLYLKEK